jgi:hypothetical protein
MLMPVETPEETDELPGLKVKVCSAEALLDSKSGAP